VPYTVPVTATRARVRDRGVPGGDMPWATRSMDAALKTLALMSIPVSPVRREGDDREDNRPLGVK